MIDRIEMIVNEINHGLCLEGLGTYETIVFSRDDWRFIQKCLTQYQAILISEANRYNNMPNKGVWNIKKGEWE